MADDVNPKTSVQDLEHVKYEMTQEISALNRQKKKEKETKTSVSPTE